jgi:hypothetical protein
MPSNSSYNFQLQGQAIIVPQQTTSQLVAIATEQKQGLMIAAKKKQLEIHNKLLFPQINKENARESIVPQTKVKIADLSHNLIGYEDQSAPQHLRKIVKSNNARQKDNGSPNLQQMSPHQQYLLQQMYS